MMGADKVVLPKDNDPPEKWNEFYNKLGRPAEPTKYDFTQVKLPPEIPIDDKQKGFLQGLFHKVGLNQKQAAVLMEEFMGNEANTLKALETEQMRQSQEAVEKLKIEWREGFDTNVALAKKAVDMLGGPEIKSLMDETGLGNDPRMVKFFHKLGSLLNEDKAFGDRMMSSGFATGSENAKAEIARLQGDPEFSKQYLTGDHPQHRQAVERMAALYKAAFPNQPS
jgi:hypothetical protein